MYMLTWLLILGHPSTPNGQAPSDRPAEPHSFYFSTLLYAACLELPPRGQRFQQVAAPATPDCFARRDLPATIKSNRHKNYEEAGLNFFPPTFNFKPLTPLFATHPKNALVTLLFATLPKTQGLKSLVYHTSKKWRGWESYC